MCGKRESCPYSASGHSDSNVHSTFRKRAHDNGIPAARCQNRPCRNPSGTASTKNPSMQGISCGAGPCLLRQIHPIPAPQPSGASPGTFGTTKIRGVKAAVGVAEGIMQPDCMVDEKTAPQAGSVLQLKVRLLGISPMIWRRILVPETMSGALPPECGSRAGRWVKHSRLSLKAPFGTPRYYALQLSASAGHSVFSTFIQILPNPTTVCPFTFTQSPDSIWSTTSGSS